MKKTIGFIRHFAALILLLLSAACDHSHGPEISVSIPPQAYLVKRIAGPEQTVNIIIPPGSAPPTYAPTPSQLRDLYDCKLYIRLGHPDFLFENEHINPFLAEHPEILTVSMSDSLDLIPGDVHLWLSPHNMRIAAGGVYRALLSIYPENSEKMSANYLTLLKDIDEIDAELRNIFRGREGTEFLSMHPSWSYFARDYGLVQLSVHGENKSPSIKQLTSLIDHARAEGIRVIFIQKEFAFQQTDVLAGELGAEVLQLDPLSENWAENMRATGRAFMRVFDE